MLRGKWYLTEDERKKTRQAMAVCLALPVLFIVSPSGITPMIRDAPDSHSVTVDRVVDGAGEEVAQTPVISTSRTASIAAMPGQYPVFYLPED